MSMRKHALFTLIAVISLLVPLPGQNPVVFPATAPVTLQGNLNAQMFENTQIVDSSLGRGGVDLGDEINKAYAACPAAPSICTILIEVNPTGGFYSYSTPIVAQTKGKYLKLVNLGACVPASSAGFSGNCLNYTPTSGNALTLDYYDTTATDPPSGHGLYGVIVVNNNCSSTNGCGGAAHGIVIGSTNGGASNAEFENSGAAGFGGTGYVATNNSGPNANWINPYFKSNRVAMQHGSLAERFTGGEISGNGCIELAATNQTPELYFANTDTFGNTGGGCAAAFDYTNVGASPGFLSLSNVHLENTQANNAHYVSGNVTFSASGGVAEDDNSTGTADWMFSLSGAGAFAGTSGLTFKSPRAYTNVFLMGANSRADVRAINGSPGYLTCGTFFGGSATAKVTSLISALNSGTNSTCALNVEGGLSVGAGSAMTSSGAGGTMAAVIASGTSTLGSTAIASGACATTVVTSAPGVAATDAIFWSYASFSAPSTNGRVILNACPTANNVNFSLCNPSAGSITPSGLTVNWRVVR